MQEKEQLNPEDLQVLKLKTGAEISVVGMDKPERIEGRKEVLLILNNEPYWVVDGNPDMENLIKAKLLTWEDIKPVKEFTFPYNNRIIGKLNIGLLLSAFIRGIKK